MTQKDSFPDLATLKVEDLHLENWLAWKVHDQWRRVNHELGLCSAGWQKFEDAMVAYSTAFPLYPAALPILRQRYLMYFGDKK